MNDQSQERNGGNVLLGAIGVSFATSAGVLFRAVKDQDNPGDQWTTFVVGCIGLALASFCVVSAAVGVCRTTTERKRLDESRRNIFERGQFTQDDVERYLSGRRHDPHH